MIVRGVPKTLLASMSKVKICADNDELGRLTGSVILAAAAAAIKQSGRFVVAFSGGSLPSLVAPHLVAEKDGVEWDKWTVVFADERVVAPGHVDLNEVECNKALFSKVPLPAENVVGIDVSDGLSDVDVIAEKFVARSRPVAEWMHQAFSNAARCHESLLQ